MRKTIDIDLTWIVYTGGIEKEPRRLVKYRNPIGWEIYNFFGRRWAGALWERKRVKAFFYKIPWLALKWKYFGYDPLWVTIYGCGVDLEKRVKKTRSRMLKEQERPLPF